jgi:hypothetical protein
MAFVPVVMAAFSAASTIFSGMQESQASRGREDVARLNESVARANSTQELRAAAQEEMRIRRNGRAQLAEQFTAFAQSGAGVGDFTTTRALEESATNAEMDALNVRYRGELGARDQGLAAEGYKAEADNEKSTRSAIAVKTAFGVGTSLLSGYNKYRNPTGNRIA